MSNPMPICGAKGREENIESPIFAARIAGGKFLDDTGVSALFIFGQIGDGESPTPEDFLNSESSRKEVLQGQWGGYLCQGNIPTLP